jgi:hypothetical protein
MTELSRASEAAPVGRAFFGGRNARRGLGGAGQRFRQAAAGRRRVSRMAPARATARTSEKGANETHASTTDPDCRLYARREAKLGSMGHVPMENRCRGRQGRPTARPSARPHAESQAPSVIASRLAPARSADTKDLAGVAPHGAQARPRPAAKASEPRHESSQKRRKMIECLFGWGTA